MTKHGAFTFVLHTHMPYARLAGRWPHGEEWVHEAAMETYIPLLNTLYDLKDDGVDYCLTIGITPVLAEQLADETILNNFDGYLDEKIAAAKRDMYLFAEDNITELEALEEAANGLVFERTNATKNAHQHFLAGWYNDWFKSIKQSFNERFGRDIIGAFKQLQDDGYIDIITSAATHAYLPLLATDNSLRVQIELGIKTYEKHFGRKPRGMWLPECAYRPAVDTDNGTRKGMEALLAEYDIEVVFSETHAVTGGNLVGVAEGKVIGPYGDIRQRYDIPNWEDFTQHRDTSTFLPYYISDSSKGDDGLEAHSGVAVIARNNSTGQQVWSSEHGYPGDFDYREFHKRAGSSGLKYWRVTGDKIDLEHKSDYQPEWADQKTDQHAEHFAHLVGDLLRDYHNHSGEFGILATTLDTELFGHWWFEGVQWLGKVLRHLADSDEIDLMSACDYVEQHPPKTTIHLTESSWGAGGHHFTWDNGDTHWMWEYIHDCEATMVKLANNMDSDDDDMVAVMNQAARELLLLQSSDWAFLVTTGQAPDYAMERFGQHVDRFRHLTKGIDAGQPDRAYADRIYELDNIFADIDYRIFAD